MTEPVLPDVWEAGAAFAAAGQPHVLHGGASKGTLRVEKPVSGWTGQASAAPCLALAREGDLAAPLLQSSPWHRSWSSAGAALS